MQLDLAKMGGLFDSVAVLDEPAVEPEPQDIVSWAHRRFRIVDVDGFSRIIQLARHQAAILKHVFTPGPDGYFPYTTVIYSTPKKSGKTTIGALVGQWVVETQGPYAEVLCVANDYDQARNRAYQSVAVSLGLDPDYNAKTREIPGEWRVREKELTHLPSQGKIKALASDYKGEAGGNPTLTLWTELWGYQSENARRFWTELTPVPTRRMSMRFIETYAGFTGESDLLEELYELGMKEGRQLTAGELGDLSAFEEAPNHDSLVPCWVNEGAGLFMYWDSGVQGRRMPWQKGPRGEQYYAAQKAILRENEFDRVHRNVWTGAESEFVPIEWWDACQDAGIPPLRTAEEAKKAKREPEKLALVVGADASVTGDCTAVVVVSRHPLHDDHVVVRQIKMWTPAEQPGKKMDYSLTLTPYIDHLVGNFRIAQVPYDEYQLHQWAIDQRKKIPSAWYRPFPQGGARLLADKGLFDLIRDRRIHHDGDPDLRTHIQNCVAKVPKGEENKMRLQKKNERRKIDLAVALSMAAYECLRLNL